MPEEKTHAEQVREFMERPFSGADLIAVLDLEGIGVGSAMHLVREVEMLRRIPKGMLGKEYLRTRHEVIAGYLHRTYCEGCGRCLTVAAHLPLCPMRGMPRENEIELLPND